MKQSLSEITKESSSVVMDESSSIDMEELLHPERAAEVLDTTSNTLKKSRNTGLLWGVPAPPFIKIGGKAIRYKRATLVAWIKALPKEQQNTAQ